jgi:hypothetical protein
MSKKLKTYLATVDADGKWSILFKNKPTLMDKFHLRMVNSLGEDVPPGLYGLIVESKYFGARHIYRHRPAIDLM